ncbi:DUF1656 domain-containing protein [Halomonas sp. HP20-15]|uniref:DUF1656 domain-containing protein n=1 Tax=Halomonas sp. HP20-15 TaxID=3085901 RepID=UPI00298164F4|nr:DUF1656 domain-containing protein [Halomonas sp. HP20-15]MDW5377855.1 DUF1656 domain-containing protein [Halomonas sp. HP20-15]
MGLKEIALGGIYLSPMLGYALLGFISAVVVRSCLHRFLRQQILWYEAWFDAALFIILTALAAFLFSAPGEAI